MGGRREGAAVTHICMPLRTAPVTRVPADPLDCPLCRRALLEAFRAPVDPERPYYDDPAPCAYCPETVEAVRMGSHVRTYHPHASPAWPPQGDPAEGPHITRTYLLTPPGAESGWIITCSCGWRKKGSVTGDLEDARWTAEAHAYRHRTDPGGDR